MAFFPALLLRPFLRFVRRLRLPWLVAMTAALFLIDVLVPDPLPFIDEALLGLLTLLLSGLRHRGDDDPEGGPRRPGL